MKRLRALVAFIAALCWLAARRLWTQRRLTAGMLVGFTVAVAAAASIPVYAAGALQRVLQADLAALGGALPASVTISHRGKEDRQTTREQYLTAGRVATEQGPALLDLPIRPLVRYGSLDVTLAEPVDPVRVNPDVKRWVNLAFLSNLEGHVAVVDGRAPAPAGADGIYEAMVEEEALDKQEFTVGAEFWVPVRRGAQAHKVKVRVVGAFRRTDPRDPYWTMGTAALDETFFVPEPVFRDQLLAADGAWLYRAFWHYGIASGDVQTHDAGRLLDGILQLESRLSQALPGTELDGGPMELLARYVQTAASLRQMLLWLAIPTLAVIAYFVVVTSGLMVAAQRQEIAVLRSRGASGGQVIALYSLEGAFLAALALVAGYPAGLLLARGIGSAAGFLQFVSRKPTPTLVPGQFYTYAVAAALLAVAAYVAPAVLAARQSIVAYKQESAARSRAPAWARWGLDLVCLALAGYGYYTLSRAPVQPAGFIDPLQILAPALLVFGAGLLLVRLLPVIMGLLARVADRWASASVYLSLVQLSRAPGQYGPVVLLLTLTVGMGLYSAAAARTMEQNTGDRIRYAGGADVQLDELWQYVESAGPDGARQITQIIAPPWEVHYSLPGVAHAARVRTQEVSVSAGGRGQSKGTLMAVDPPDFGRVAWFRRDLAPYHLNQYLNLLSREEEGVLVPGRFLAENRLQVGDSLTLTAAGRELPLVILGALDYWPSLYTQDGPFFVANLDYAESKLGIAPYKVWLKMQEGAGLEPAVTTLQKQGVVMLGVQDARHQLILARRDPQVAGLLGGLSSGFLLAAAVTVLGFWLFAALSARARTLQFGVLRAVGLSTSQLIGLVGLEQLLAVAAGVAAGTGAGLGAARLFVPLMQRGAGSAAQTPPFTVVTLAADSVRLYAVLAGMLAAGLAGLVLALIRLRVHEAIKLGEDH